MSHNYYEKCPYCDTEYRVEFEKDDDELMYCPSCGEQVPEECDDDYEIEEDDEWDE